MSVPEYISDHTERAKELMLGQFRDKLVIEALLKTWTDVIQEVETDLYSLMTKTLFLNAEGSNLERYGQLFGIPFPEGLTDKEYRETLISEIMRRSSDGTPDRIRQILEATTGVYGARIFEHYNANQQPWVMGCNVVYGYAEEGIEFDVALETREARLLAWASPITTGSCVLGVHKGDPTNLFIPSEIVFPLSKVALSSNLTTNPTFDANLSGWTYSSPYISWLETFPDAENPDGVLKVDVAGTANSPVFSQTVSGLAAGDKYLLSISQTNTQGYSSLASFVTPDKWLPKFRQSTAINQVIVTPDFDQEGTFRVSMDVIWDGAMGVLYLFDSSTSTPSNRAYLNITGGFLNIPDDRIQDFEVFVDGVKVSDNQYEFQPYKKTNIVAIIQNGLAFGVIGNKFSRDLAFSGHIYNFSIVDDTTDTVLRNYPMLTTSGTMPVTTTIDDTVGTNDGVMTNFTTWANVESRTIITGTEVATLYIADSSGGTLTVTSNMDAHTNALFYFDSIELHNEDVSREFDELVNETDDWIGVRGEDANRYAIGYKNGILPEIENRIERFQVDTSLAGIIDPITGRGIEDFNVETAVGIDEFNVEYRDAGKPARNYGVMLEISQIMIDEAIG